MFGNHKTLHRQTFSLYSVLLILAVIGAVTANADLGDPPNNDPPSITYTCNNNKIDNITVSDGTYDNIKVNKKNGGYCKRTKDGQDGLLGCAQLNMNGQHLKLLYEDDKEADVFAGKRFFYYDLSCDEMTETKTATLTLKDFSVTEPPERTTLKANQHSQGLSLTVTPNNDLFVGKDLTLTMKMTDVGSKYLLSPQECNAHRPRETEKITIWECSKPASNPNIINQLTWTLGVGQDVTSVSIPLFAFKFIDSPEVIIECSTKVCPVKPGTEECNLTKCAPAPTVAGRKRRSQNGLTGKMNTPIGHASVSLEVKDLLFTKSSVSGLTARWYAYAVPAFLLIGSRLYL